jgi:hypothetical protein
VKRGQQPHLIVPALSRVLVNVGEKGFVNVVRVDSEAEGVHVIEV